MTEELLDLPAKRGRLHALTAAGVLAREELGRGLALAGLRPTARSWSAYLYWNTLIIAVVLLVAGAVFFVAANWSALSGFARMGIVGGVMVAATLVGASLGETLAGRVSSLLGGLLFGPLVAVYGQVYQTGADAWELFALWAVVLAAYAALVRFVGTWILALVCVHVACFTWMDQELGLEPFEGPGVWILLAVVLVDFAVVALAETFMDEGRPRSILSHTAAFFGLALLLPYGVIALVDAPGRGSWPGLVLQAGALAAIWLRYRWRRPDLGMLAMFAGVVTILATALFGRILLDEMDAELFGVAALGLIVCAMVWGLTRWLLAWRREHGEPPVRGRAPADIEGQGGREGDPR